MYCLRAVVCLLALWASPAPSWATIARTSSGSLIRKASPAAQTPSIGQQRLHALGLLTRRRREEQSAEHPRELSQPPLCYSSVQDFNASLDGAWRERNDDTSLWVCPVFYDAFYFIFILRSQGFNERVLRSSCACRAGRSHVPGLRRQPLRQLHAGRTHRHQAARAPGSRRRTLASPRTPRCSPRPAATLPGRRCSGRTTAACASWCRTAYYRCWPGARSGCGGTAS